IDGEAGSGGGEDQAHRGPPSRRPFLWHAARLALRDEGRQADRAQSNSGVRARQVVLQRGTLSSEERWLRILRPHQVPADRSVIRRPIGVQRLGELLTRLSVAE